MSATAFTARRIWAAGDGRTMFRAEPPVATVLSALLMLLTLPACSSSSRPTAAPGTIDTLRTIESPASLDTTSFDLSQPPLQVFDRYVDGDLSSQITRSQLPTSRYGAQIETTDSADERPLRTLYWSREESGDYVLHATIEHADNALTLLNPPLLLLPAMLAPGESVTVQSAMRVLHADNPRREREQGTATQTITLFDRREISTLHETAETLYFEIEFHADLRFADIRETTLIYRDSATGDVIAEQNRQRISILALPPSDKETLLLRLP